MRKTMHSSVLFGSVVEGCAKAGAALVYARIDSVLVATSESLDTR